MRSSNHHHEKIIINNCNGLCSPNLNLLTSVLFITTDYTEANLTYFDHSEAAQFLKRFIID